MVHGTRSGAGSNAEEGAVAHRPTFASLPPQTLPGRVSSQLLAGILRGDFQPGQELPAEDQLAREFGVSRPVVRDAVKHLALLGMVESRQGRQSRIASYHRWNHLAPELLAARRDVGVVEDVLLEVLELRRMIEVEAAAAAATRATPSNLTAMEEALAELDQSLDDLPRFTQSDIAFHNAMLEATQNHLLPSLFEMLRPMLTFAREISLTARAEGPSISQAGHRAVFAAIRSGSAEDARAAMADHLSWTANLDITERNVRLAIDRARRE